MTPSRRGTDEKTPHDARATDNNLKAGERLSMFLRSAIPDFLLVLLVSTALVYTVSYGFNSAADIRGNILLEGGIGAALLVALFAGSWSKRALLPSAIATVVLTVGIIMAFAAMMPAETSLFVDGQVNDVPENYLIFAFIAVIVPIVVYLLSRRSVGLVVLLALGIVSCGTVQFLYRDWMTSQPGLIASVLVLFGIGVMFVFQCYRQSIYSAKRAKRTAFGGAFAFALVVAGVCVAAGIALFFGVIGPLGITTPSIKPFQDYFSRPVVEFNATYDDQQVDNPDITANQTNDEMDDSNQDAPGGDTSDATDESGNQASNPLTGVAQAMSAFSPDNWNQQFNAISYNIPDYMRWLLPALVAVLIVAAILLRRYLRTYRLKRMRNRSYSYRVCCLYGFLMKRFKYLKIVKQPSMTPLEYALSARTAMTGFARNTGKVDFVRVTTIYQRACYGGIPLTEEEYQQVERYYRAFFDNARQRVGKLKWLWKFWRV